jgi:hypothetical protein
MLFSHAGGDVLDPWITFNSCPRMIESLGWSNRRLRL